MKRGALPTLSYRETSRFAAVFATNGPEIRPLCSPLGDQTWALRSRNACCELPIDKEKKRVIAACVCVSNVCDSVWASVAVCVCLDLVLPKRMYGCVWRVLRSLAPTVAKDTEGFTQHTHIGATREG